MNVNDVNNIPHVEPEKFLSIIWERQTELLKKYQEIEDIPNWPFDIDNAEHQIWIKDFLWRVTEEISESWEARDDLHDETHQIEELADALHFIIECLILCGERAIWNLPSLVESLEKVNISMQESYFRTFYIAGLVGNTLKNRKWKQTQMQTDKNKFSELLRATFEHVISCFVAVGCSAEEIYIYYFKKSEVNKFRQRTKY